MYLSVSPLEEVEGFLTGRPGDVSAQGLQLHHQDRLSLVTNTDAFPGPVNALRVAQQMKQKFKNSELNMATREKRKDVK